MTKEELFKLIDCGFTKDEILQLNGTKEFNAEPQQDDPQQSSENATKDVEENKVNEKAIETSAFSNMFDEMNAKIEGLTKTIQKSNINNDSFGEESKKTTNDIISSIISPRKEN